MRNRPVILLIEDDDAIAEMVLEYLRSFLDAQVIHARSATETIGLELEEAPDLVLTDILLPDGNGLDLIRLLFEPHECPVIFITGQPTLDRAVEALRAGGKEFFAKPFDLELLGNAARTALDEHAQYKQEQRRRERLEVLVRKVIQERKELQQRVDLVCQDLVSAYRGLAHRFVHHQSPHTQHPNA